MSGPGQLILLGAGGHAKVVLALARAAGLTVSGVCAPELADIPFARWNDVPVLGDETILFEMGPRQVALINGIGQMPGSTLRRDVFARFRSKGFIFPALVHPRAWVAPDVTLGMGVQIMAGAIVQPACRIGDNSVLNTGAQADHDCRVGADVHIAPGAVLCGDVVVGNNAFVGAGAVVIQAVTIGPGAVIAAGSLTKK